MSFAIVFAAIVVFLLWVGFSVLAFLYWFKTPKEMLDKIIQKDFTKRFMWWYGFLFSIFIAFVFFFSFVAVIAFFIINNLGLLNV